MSRRDAIRQMELNERAARRVIAYDTFRTLKIGQVFDFIRPSKANQEPDRRFMKIGPDRCASMSNRFTVTNPDDFVYAVEPPIPHVTDLLARVERLEAALETIARGPAFEESDRNAHLSMASIARAALADKV